MAVKDNAVVLEFETKGQIQYAKTIKDINAIMNAAAKEYRAHIKAMGDDASATDKLASEKKKLETQLEAGRERTAKLRAEFEKMQGSTKTTTAQLNNMYSKLKDSESAEAALENRLKQVNSGLSDQAKASRDNQDALSKLQKESSVLESETQKLNSEFELLESRMGSNASESDKAALAHQKYARQSELVTNQIKNLEKQLELVKQEFGENSVEANKMETELNQAKTAFNSLNSEMKQTVGASDEAQTGLGKLTDVVKSQAMLEASQQLSQVSDQLIEIGKTSIETAATFQANEAQFEQVFGNMKQAATESAESMGKEFDMMPNRLKPGLSKMTSMFKGLGIETDEALKMAEDAVRSSADAAAFYDKSFEDANGALTSFLKGNYEAGESVGIFANETQLAAYAVKNNLIPATEGATQATEEQMIALEKAQAKYNEAAGKYGESSLQARDAMLKVKKAQDDITEATGEQTGKWKDLDEATKQAIRLEYIQNMQEMAGATGQAARESGEYENQMGNAKQAVSELMNELGKPMLEMFLQTLQIIIPALKSFAEWFGKLNPFIKEAIILFGAVIAVIGVLLPLIASFGLIATAGMLPVIGIIAAIGAAIAAVILIVKNWETIMLGLKVVVTSVIDWIVSKFNSVIDTANKVKDGIANAFTSAMDWAKDIVNKGVEAIKGFFDFDWKLPELKLPHFKMKGEFSLKPPSVPTIGVDWYAKGGIFTKPTIFGESGGRPQGAGEAGPEAVLPLNDETLAAIGKGIPFKGGGGDVHIHIAKVDANNPSDLDRTNRKLYQAAKQAIIDAGGVPV